MYNQIVSIYSEIFPTNEDFVAFITACLGPSGSSVLDLGCGPGDYVDLFSKSGYRVAGIDSSQLMIEHARKTKQGAFYPYSFEEIGKLEESFHCIFSIGNSLSYLPGKQRQGFLAHIFSMQKEGGKLVVQVINWDQYLLSGFKDFDVKTLRDGRKFHRRFERTPEDVVLFHTELRLGEKILEAWSAPLYPIISENFKKELAYAGYSISGIYGDYKKTPFIPGSSPALIVTAEKSLTG